MSCCSLKPARKSVDFIFQRPRAKTALHCNTIRCEKLGMFLTKEEREQNRAKTAAEKKKSRDPPTASGALITRSRAFANKDKQNVPIKLPKKELERLKEVSKVYTQEQKVQNQLMKEEAARRNEEEAERTKKMFQRIDEARLQARGDMKEEDLFEEERLKVLEQSFIARHEQEEEVKRVNQIMLNAKCHVVRDAQMQEKNDLARELEQEEKRLEKMMIERAKASFVEEDENVKKEQEKKQQYAAIIKSQLAEREHQRFLETERIEEEAKLRAIAVEALKQDEERQARMVKERREQLRLELDKICEMSNYMKELLFAQEKEAEMRVQAYMKTKEQRERTLNIEKKLAKQAFERKQQLLFVIQQKIHESKSKREEMGLTRQQENIEREYRRKEKEAVLRKIELEKSLHEARVKQLEEIKLREALHIARNEDDFKAIVENLKREEAKQQKIQEERMKNRERYREDIVKQMNDNENARRKRQEMTLAEANEWKEREKQRGRNIKAVIKYKLDAMRDANLPEKYIKDVEKQMMKLSEQ